jgi:hypothetical protein
MPAIGPQSGGPPDVTQVPCVPRKPGTFEAVGATVAVRVAALPMSTVVSGVPGTVVVVAEGEIRIVPRFVFVLEA